jgi:hypothetical protein
MRERMQRGAKVAVGVEHPQYRAATELGPEVRNSLAADLH